MKLLYALAALLALSGLPACGGTPEKTVDKDSIRRNADRADRNADRESDRRRED